jgi:hypothetical protein
MLKIVKFNYNEFLNFKNSISQTLAGIDIFRPIYPKDKNITTIFGTYCFINHVYILKEHIKHHPKYKKSINYFLNNYKIQRPQILSFIDYLKHRQDTENFHSDGNKAAQVFSEL